MCKIAKERKREGRAKRWHVNLTAAVAAALAAALAAAVAAALAVAVAAAPAAVWDVVKVRPGEKFSHALRTIE